jgi:hypothetical protein
VIIRTEIEAPGGRSSPPPKSRRALSGADRHGNRLLRRIRSSPAAPRPNKYIPASARWALHHSRIRQSLSFLSGCDPGGRRGPELGLSALRPVGLLQRIKLPPRLPVVSRLVEEAAELEQPAAARAQHENLAKRPGRGGLEAGSTIVPPFQFAPPSLVQKCLADWPAAHPRVPSENHTPCIATAGTAVGAGPRATSAVGATTGRADFAGPLRPAGEFLRDCSRQLTPLPTPRDTDDKPRQDTAPMPEPDQPTAP